MIKVILIDDETLACAVIRTYLKHFDDMEVVHQLDKVIEKIEKWIDDQTRP